MGADSNRYDGGTTAGGTKDAALRKAIDAALQDSHDRVIRLDLPDGRRVWLKQVETLSARLRLQKGDPARALRAERAALGLLAVKNMPVPTLLADGPGYFALADSGPTLMDLVADQAVPVQEKLNAFADAGRALAALHLAGFAHGRPAPRDICWDGRMVRFIDLERFSTRRGGRVWQALDLVVFVQSCFSKFPQDMRWLDTAFAAYAKHGPKGRVAYAARLARFLAPLGWLTRQVLRMKPDSRELRAVPLTLAYLTGWHRRVTDAH